MNINVIIIAGIVALFICLIFGGILLFFRETLYDYIEDLKFKILDDFVERELQKEKELQKELEDTHD